MCSMPGVPEQYSLILFSFCNCTSIHAYLRMIGLLLRGIGPPGLLVSEASGKRDKV